MAQLPSDVVGPSAGRRVAAQGQEASHPHAQETGDDVDGLLLAVSDAGQVGHEGDGAGLEHVSEHPLGGVGLLLDHSYSWGLIPLWPHRP